MLHFRPEFECRDTEILGDFRENRLFFGIPGYLDYKGFKYFWINLLKTKSFVLKFVDFWKFEKEIRGTVSKLQKSRKIGSKNF